MSNVQQKSSGKCICAHTPMVEKKPVISRNIGQHGFLGAHYVNQHHMVDTKWTLQHIGDQFKNVTNLLKKRLQFNKMEKAYHQRNLRQRLRLLRAQCRDGRKTIKQFQNQNQAEVKYILIDHKDLQRLYRNMDLFQIEESINDRTFRMRKERDRLLDKMRRLKDACLTSKKQLSEVQLRVECKEDGLKDLRGKIANLEKRIVNSNTRTEAIKTINVTYKTIKKTLQDDAIFHEPILKSLEQDINDQMSFIEHILYLGAPAIKKFKQISAEYNAKQISIRRNMERLKLIMNARTIDAPLPKVTRPSNRSSEEYTCAGLPSMDWSENSSKLHLHAIKYYVRDTCSMLKLRAQLVSVNAVIKKIKRATFRSYALEIYPTIKNYVEENHYLRKRIETKQLQCEVMQAKRRRAGVTAQVLQNNLQEEHRIRMHKISYLQDAIEKEDDEQAKILRTIKLRSDIYAVIRWTLWSLNDVLRHVRVQEPNEIVYPNKELKLPLLKFDMLDMRAVPPNPFEENVNTLMQMAIERVRVIVSVFNSLNRTEVVTTPKFRNDFEVLLHQIKSCDTQRSIEVVAPLKKEEHDEDLKSKRSVPTRDYIKTRSMKIIEAAHNTERLSIAK